MGELFNNQIYDAANMCMETKQDTIMQLSFDHNNIFSSNEHEAHLGCSRLWNK